MPETLAKARTSTDLYDRDFYEWTVVQAQALRDMHPTELDWENLAEEIESLGRSSRSEVRSRMTVLLQHLLKWEHQPDGRSNSWAASILEQRQRIADVIEESPTLGSYPESVVEKEYRIARLRAAGDTDLPIERFPTECPYSIGDILREDFFPGRGA
jgi:hypothetical protein